jgi:hypothetical protein
MNEMEKLQVLIPLWVERNDEYAEEYQLWAEGTADETSADLFEAVDAMKRVNQALVAALEKLGGPTIHPHS